MSMMLSRTLWRVIRRLERGIQAIDRCLVQEAASSPLEKESARWRQARGDETLRVDYDLNADSLVLDLGGFRGDWTSDIFSRYRCEIHVFEAVKEYADGIRKRFEKNPQIRVHPFGLSNEDRAETIAVNGYSSSVHKRGENRQTIVLKKAADYFSDNGIEHVDLMKINIEGGEYDLLDHLLDTGLIDRVENIQVQFHDFVPEAERRMRAVQERLSKTHCLTYQFKFVWENWKRIPPD